MPLEKGKNKIGDDLPANTGLPMGATTVGAEVETLEEQKKAAKHKHASQRAATPDPIVVSPAAPIYDAVPRDCFGASSANDVFKGRTF